MRASSDRDLRPQECLDQKVKENRPTFFLKKMGVCFLHVFDPSTPKASNCDPTTRAYFTCNFFLNLSPFKSKYLTTITEAITLGGLLTILVFKMYNRLNTGLKIDTKRMRVCKNAKYIITSLSFAQFRNSRYHQNQDIISYTFA